MKLKAIIVGSVLAFATSSVYASDSSDESPLCWAKAQLIDLDLSSMETYAARPISIGKDIMFESWGTGPSKRKKSKVSALVKDVKKSIEGLEGDCDEYFTDRKRRFNVLLPKVEDQTIVGTYELIKTSEVLKAFSYGTVGNITDPID